MFVTLRHRDSRPGVTRGLTAACGVFLGATLLAGCNTGPGFSWDDAPPPSTRADADARPAAVPYEPPVMTTVVEPLAGSPADVSSVRSMITSRDEAVRAMAAQPTRPGPALSEAPTE